jgi:hypothetical protein
MSTALSLRRNPVSLVFSMALWVGVRYMFTYLFVAWGLFAVALTILVGGGLLSVTFVGLPVLIAAAALIRGCANFERARLRSVDPRPITGAYREVAGSGTVARLRTRWGDPAIWRDIAYLFGMLAPLWTLDFGVLTVWLVFLAGITLPAWYWAPWQTIHGVRYHGYQLGYFPNGPHGHPGYGFYIDTLPKALLAAAVFLILFLLFNYVVVATARLHAAAARALLRPAEDPLREVKEVLRRPGPLNPVIPNGPR